MHISPLPSRVQHTPAIWNSFVWLDALPSPLPRHTPLVKKTTSALQFPQALILWTIQIIMTQCFKSSIFNIYLLKGHILILETFVGCRHVLQSTVCLLLLGITTISLHKRTYDSSFYLFIYGLFIIIYLFPQEYLWKRMQQLCQIRAI